jgi:phosphotriesterase-related protein
MSFVRTVLGDIAPEHLGICYAHEHIIIDPGLATERNPDFLLDSVDKAVHELRNFFDAGGRAMVDSMPCDCGRNILKLAEVSRQSGVHIVAPTGIHLQKYYAAGHWSVHYSEEQLANLFVGDIVDGIDAFDYKGPIVERTRHKAGVIKVATGLEKISRHERKILSAAVVAHQATGCPILTHCEQGTAGPDQVRFFASNRVQLGKVVLSHLDRKPDLGYHREILQSGVRVEYDSAFRWKEENHTLRLIEQLFPEFPDQIMLGMDAARRGYWQSYGGQPGLAFLLTTFRKELEQRLPENWFQKIFVENPAATFPFDVYAAKV